MYILIAVVAASAYALQGTLMASFYRKMDPLSAISYRGLALGLVMLPLLAFVPAEQFYKTSSFFGHILLCAVLAALGNWLVANSYKSLPVGVAWALSESFRTITAIGFAILLLHEALNPYQLGFIAALLVCVSILCTSSSSSSSSGGSGKDPVRNANPAATYAGIVFTMGFGVFIGWSMSLIGTVARECNPLVLAFEWEFTIGLIGVLLAWGRRLLKDKEHGLASINRLSFGKIALYSSPTVIGTYGFAVASQMGSIAIVSAVLSVSTVAAAIIAFLLYKERLTALQCGMIAVSCLIIAGLNLLEFTI